MDVRFTIVSPPSKRRSLGVRLPILIGRAEEAKFRIQQDSVSRRHCEVFIKDGGVYVRDLASTNGTFLDGEQVTASVASFVRPGSEIRLGGVAFRVEYQPTDAALAPDDDTASLETGSLEKGPLDRSPVADASAPAPADAEPAAEDARWAMADGSGGEDAPAAAEADDAPPMLDPAAGAEAGTAGDDDNLTDFFKSLK